MKTVSLIVLSSIALFCHTSLKANSDSEKPKRFNICINGGRQAYNSASYLLKSVMWSDKYKVDDHKFLSFRLGFSALDFRRWNLETSAAFQLNTTTTFYDDRQVGGSSSIIDHLSSDHEYKYSAIGAMFNFKGLIGGGIGLDYRFEKTDLAPASNVVDWTGSTSPGTNATYKRFWARLKVEVNFRLEKITPYIGIEAAYPLSSYSYNDSSPYKDLAKALAPKQQLGIVLGLKF